MTAATPLSTGRRPPAGTSRTRRGRVGWLFVGPFMAVFALVFLAPICYSLYLSFFRDQLVGGTSFVGLDNFQRAFEDDQFWSALGRVAVFLAVQVPVMLGLALLVALALDSGRLYGKSFFRISVFLPYAVPAVVATLMWGFIYGTRFGLVGNINDALGVSLPDPLSPSLVLASIGNIVTWEFIGYNMLIFYSALRVVPKSLYEAAEIDGAGQWRIIAAVKIPAIRGALVIATIFSVIGSFQLFNEPSILQSLAPNAITTYFTPNLYTFTLSFSGRQQNYAATVSLVMGVVTMIIAYAVQLRGMRKEA
ncbi:carbohydrate ABC transporter permease [Streptomyces halstedii]|uniref:carbohydrate ABC transporter permease n=1 Tax=Streptomyces TaxID=1883 RepID=UPI00048CE9DF|nr:MULTISPECIES: sugar ABC transporter permease [Streptomyces]WSX39686.1 sugar ABC transporter permease [Streptomyces halstedii]KDQ65516.1 sugar ABC transporter permease [Streptomyces sp. NTK 937]MCW8219771.1 sugar ABC transporter permease [Streptomyces griseolus]MYQ50426.1 ABC transporter permease subunit [Streptomyces sp. SID4941]MYY18644.1 ABC transporter permease subunit [Streptomyces sp. SID4912]